ncbi:MAG: hypothetical protein H6Q73_2357 [Firmicutes bacterium]|nr:hypothetical protein [Bacillota bacterium]
MKNKAVVIQSPQKLQVIDLPIGIPAADEVLVRIHYVALCGSDKKLYAGTYTAPHKYPLIIGHEWVGEVIQAGVEASAKWLPGDIVTGDCSLYCGSCSFCDANNKNHCLNVKKKGIMVDGACAQHIIVNQRHLYHCPVLPDIKALALTEPMAVAVESIINRIPPNKLNKVRQALIIGAGGIGIMALLGLLEQGIPEITIADMSPEKLAVVDSFGFSNVTTVLANFSDANNRLTGHFDLAVEAAGNADALTKIIELANPCGQIVCIGHQQKLTLDFGLIMKKSLTISANIGSTGGFEQALKIISHYSPHINKIISRVLTLETINTYFTSEISSMKDIKVLIDLHSS